MSERTSIRPQFTMQFSLGNIVTIVGVLFAVISAWNNLDSRVQSNAERIEITRANDKNFTAAMNVSAARVRANEIAITRQDERTNSILSGLGRIEGQLERINRRLNGQ